MRRPAFRRSKDTAPAGGVAPLSIAASTSSMAPCFSFDPVQPIKRARLAPVFARALGFIII
tara:strand:+ start:342 stop:524 length:183 start_codon:yes stop_codon:yes gene_type:complete